MPKLIAIVLWLLPMIVYCQQEVGIEHYYFSSSKGLDAFVPKIYGLGKKGWQAEFRYNYEDLRTGSFHVGKEFTIDKAVSLKLTPLIGGLIGNTNGVSFSAEIDLTYKKLSFLAEPQYILSVNNRDESYTYSWSELSFAFSDLFYSGLALQHTKLYRITDIYEPGLLIGFTFKKFDFPLYLFQGADKKKYVVIGFNWKWTK